MGRVKVEWRSASKEQYNKFISLHPELKVSFLDFQNIIYSFNFAFRDYLLETGFKGKFPWGFGDFAIQKRLPKKVITSPTGEKRIGLPVDWKKSKLYGKRIYHLNNHTDGYKFKWKWFIFSARIKYADIWMFKPSRVTSRILKHYIDNGYADKYLPW